MYQLKIFTGPTPMHVEDSVNHWLSERSEVGAVRLAQAASTDVVQVSTNSGIQRFTLVLLYEVH